MVCISDVAQYSSFVDNQNGGSAQILKFPVVNVLQHMHGRMVAGSNLIAAITSSYIKVVVAFLLRIKLFTDFRGPI